MPRHFVHTTRPATSLNDVLVGYRLKRTAALRATLPYGIWICADGRQILFNRDYEPIWQRRPGQSAERADPDEWVKYKTQRWFFKDGNSPWVTWPGHKQAVANETRRRCEAVLREWGVD